MKRRPSSDPNHARKQMDDIANLFVDPAGCRTPDVVRKSVRLESNALPRSTDFRTTSGVRQPAGSTNRFAMSSICLRAWFGSLLGRRFMAYPQSVAPLGTQGHGG